jgi:YidC/Oxa1 family membrane protein insertase
MLVTANIFQPLIDVFETVIKFFHNTVGVPWGLSIVLLTVVIRAIMIPLTVKQFASMRALQTLQPQLKEIQAKYKDDKQRQQQELMKFYKENNVNPLGSCLPMVAQLPVFISLFYMLRKNLRVDICSRTQSLFQQHYAALHQVTAKVAAAQTIPCVSHGYHSSAAGFLFIPDLTNNATGAVLITLVILYVGTQLGSTLMMQSPTMDQTQRRLMLFMPLIFVLFIIRFPAGVLVYWITTNSWTMAQQFVIRRRLGPVVPVAVGSAGGTSVGGKGGRSTASSSNGSGSGKGSAKGNVGSGKGNVAATKGNLGTAKGNLGSGKGNGGSSKGNIGSAGNGIGSGGVGSSSSGGLGSALRARLKPPSDAPPPAANGNGRGVTPPPPPRKKKKRSGKR